MKHTLWIEGVAMLGMLVSFTYLLLLALSRVNPLPFAVSENFFLRDWAFLALPLLSFLSGILLQLAARRRE